MRRKELRAIYRFPARLDVPVIMRFADAALDEQEVPGYARNLNRDGLSVTLDTFLLPGTSVRVEIHLPARVILASGDVVRNQRYQLKNSTRVANGIRFTAIEPDDRDEISKYLFWQIAPREMSALQLTHMSQREE
jgi:hypothetical protein